MINSFYELMLYTVWIYGLGVLLGYILWAPLTPFKSGMMDGLTFGPIRRYIARRVSFNRRQDD